MLQEKFFQISAIDKKRYNAGTMNINNEDQAKEAIALWRTDSPRVQSKNLRLALESLELSEMYYEQKGNEQGMTRAVACQAIIIARLAEIDVPDKC